jgi:hypothetical protein
VEDFEAELGDPADDVRHQYVVDNYQRFSDCETSNDCKLLLAVSGLGPPPNTDPCFDEIGPMFQSVAGLRAAWVDEYDCCDPKSESGAGCDAKRAAKATLLRLANSPFAADCR